MPSDQQPPSVSSEAHCTDVAAFLRLLHGPGDVFEVRVINCPERAGGSFVSTVAGWFNDPAAAAQAVAEIERVKPPAVYVTVNPCLPGLMGRAANRLLPKSKSTTKDPDIVRRRWVFVDIDAKRPAGVSSTDPEVIEAQAVADTLRRTLTAEGWPEPLLGMSGNGAYLLWRVDLPNDGPSNDLIEQTIKAMAARFDTDGAEVDCSTFNPSRICKLLGTVARKGDAVVGVDGIDDRPHRRSWFIMPEGPLQVVAPEKLKALAAEVVEPESPKSPEPAVSRSVPGDVFDRCCKYLAKMDPAVSGELGSRRLFHACCVALHDFGLSDAEAIRAIEQAYNPRCVPPWDAAGINRAIGKARRDGGPSSGFGSASDGPEPDLSMLTPGPSERIDGAAKPAADDPWDDPIPVDAPEVGPFPVSALPGVLGQWVEAMTEAAQVPSELPGLLALAVCSGALARRVEVVAGRGWREPVNLYVCCLLDPANRKSAVFRAAVEPLRTIEADLVEVARPEVARMAADRRMIEAQAKKAESKAAGGDASARAEALELAEQLAAEPVPSLPRLIVDDATAEAVEMALASQGGRLIVAGPEGGLFDVMAGRYSSAAGNLDVFLKGHAGDDLVVDRVIRGSLFVPRCCLTLAYAVQPEVIRGLADKPSFRGRGLIGRFLYAVPTNRLGSRLDDPEPVPDSVAAGYASLVRRLFEVPADEDGPRLLTIAPEAAEVFRPWRREVEAMLADNGRLASMRDWGGKLSGLTARLAAVVHLARYADTPDPISVPVGPESIEAAMTLARWAIDHAEAAIGLMAGGDGSLDDAGYVLRWLRERGQAEVTRRDVYQFGRARFTAEPLRLDRALALLVDRGWLRPNDDRPVGPGRPSVRYLVHPMIGGRDAGVTIKREPVSAPMPPWESSGGEPAGRVRMVI